MFQYAAGLALAQRLGARLQLDLSWFKPSTQNKVTSQRPYELKVFRLADRVTNYHPTVLSQGVATILGNKLTRYTEPHYHYDPNIALLGDNTLIDGYWQSPRYFEAIVPMLTDDFDIKPDPSPANQAYLEAIKSVPAVSLHVRRGDYVSSASTNSFHGTAGPDYYDAATKRIQAEVPKAHYFVFSDDVAWCKDNLNLGKSVTFIEGNDGDKSYEDLRLMSACRHHIIANSSFSWWGAWLNPSPEKLVIAPKQWFASQDINTGDLIPQDWTRI